jgi:hypothetical protein
MADALTETIRQCTFLVLRHVTSAVAADLGGLKAQLVDKNVGGDGTLAHGQTNGDGAYALNQIVSPIYLRSRCIKHHKASTEIGPFDQK